MNDAPRKPSTLGEALDAWINQSGFKKRLDLAAAVSAWPGLSGPQIAAVTPLPDRR